MANVLKPDSDEQKVSAARDVSGLAGFNLSDLADEGRQRLDQCREKVRAMLDQAARDAENLKQQSDRNGYEEGLKRAAVDADRKLNETAQARARDGLEVLEKAVREMHAAHEAWMHQYAQCLVQITLSAAERIVGRTLEKEPQLLVQWASDALRSTRSAASLTLAVHPETLATLGPAFDQLLASNDLPEKTHVEPDESVGRQQVRVLQNGGSIEAGLSAQLQRLTELLS